MTKTTQKKSIKSGSKISQKKSKKTYWILKGYQFKDIDISKYHDPNGFEKPAELPKIFHKMIRQAFQTVGSNFYDRNFYGVEGFYVIVKPKGHLSSPYVIISSSSPKNPETYIKREKGLFNILHFPSFPSNLSSDLEITFYKKERTPNKIFKRYRFNDIKTEKVSSGSTFIIPKDTYIKFNVVNSTSGKKEKFPVLWFQCYS